MSELQRAVAASAVICDSDHQEMLANERALLFAELGDACLGGPMTASSCPERTHPVACPTMRRLSPPMRECTTMSSKLTAKSGLSATSERAELICWSSERAELSCWYSAARGLRPLFRIVKECACSLLYSHRQQSCPTLRLSPPQIDSPKLTAASEVDF